MNESYSRPIPLLAIVLVALAVHGPLLLMQLPAGSFDTNFHIFLASHYAHHWFNPWNEKWFAGFSQTTYPPLTHQWIALLSNVAGLKMGYMLVQLIAVLLLPVGVFRFAKIWVDERAASYAALGSIFLGALAFLVYQAGQLATVTSAALYLNALPYFYEWATRGIGPVADQGSRGQLDGCRGSPRDFDFRRRVFRRTGVVDRLRRRSRRAQQTTSVRSGHRSGRWCSRFWWESAWASCCCPTGWR